MHRVVVCVSDETANGAAESRIPKTYFCLKALSWLSFQALNGQNLLTVHWIAFGPFDGEDLEVQHSLCGRA